jgi:diguanylate cyclase (GGDEF)-like protein
LSEALIVAERLRESVQALSFSAPLDGLTITVSIGVATFPSTQVDSIDTLLKKADDALYRAKHAGRNRVELNY